MNYNVKCPTCGHIKKKSKRLPIKATIKKRIWEEQKGKCKKCKMSLDFYFGDVDHIIPIVEGGTNARENLQFLCGACHQEKTELEHKNRCVPNLLPEVMDKFKCKCGKEIVAYNKKLLEYLVSQHNLSKKHREWAEGKK